MDTIDFRSDTATWPTPEMREAMANAKVGDDVEGEDPTINQLEVEAAEMLGKQAGLFVSSGHQGNLVSLLTHCARGEEVILGDKAHTFKYEAGSVSAYGGIQPHTIPVHEDGTLDLEDIHHAIRDHSNVHFPRTRLICLENTQGTVSDTTPGGVPVPKSYIDKVAEIAQENDIKLHIDGARIFNAATALNTPAKALVENVDSMTFCLSKGLCAPVGSIIVGDADFINKARRVRKSLGGGMRQAGILGAAGLIAIHKMTNRLQEDHDNAQYIGENLKSISGVKVKSTYTNFAVFELAENAKLSPESLIKELKDSYNIIITPYPSYTHVFRIVTHYWITRERTETFVNAMKELLS